MMADSENQLGTEVGDLCRRDGCCARLQEIEGKHRLIAACPDCGWSEDNQPKLSIAPAVVDLPDLLATIDDHRKHWSDDQVLSALLQRGGSSTWRVGGRTFIAVMGVAAFADNGDAAELIGSWLNNARERLRQEAGR